MAFHAAACLLIWRVLVAVGMPGAWLGAALFAVHPVTAASVGWVAEQKNTLSLIFYALAILAYLRFDRGGRWWNFAISALGFAAALLAKQTTVVLPAVLAIILLYRGRLRWSFRCLVPLATLFVMAAAAAFLVLHFHSRSITPKEWIAPAGAAARVMLAAKAIGFYFAKAVVPIRLNMIYSRAEPTGLDALALTIPVLVALGIALLLFRRRAWAKAAAAIGGCFVISLAPVLGLVDFIFMLFSYFSDHLCYLALPVVTAAMAFALAMLWRQGRGFRILSAGAAAAMLALFALATSSRAAIFANSQRLWLDVEAKNPTAYVAQDHLAAACFFGGDYAPAISHYQKAIAYAPPGHAVRYRFNLAIILVRMNRLNEARDVLERSAWELATDEDAALAHGELGTVYLLSGDYAGARDELLKSIQEKEFPVERAGRLNNLAYVLSEQLHQPQEALKYATEAVRLAPSEPKYLDTLGWTYFLAGDMAPAQKYLYAAIQRAVEPIYYYHLGMVLESQHCLDDALKLYRRGLEGLKTHNDQETYIMIEQRLEAIKAAQAAGAASGGQEASKR